MYVFKPSNTEYQRHIDTKSVLYAYTTIHQKAFNGSRERERVGVLLPSLLAMLLLLPLPSSLCR